MAVAIVIFFSLLRMQLSLSTVIIAHITFCISYVIIVVGARLAGMDRSIEEAALDLGANEWTTFFRITLPIAAPAILSAALLVFTTSFDDYLITSFVAGVRSTTLPLEIYSRLKRGITPEINAISTVILAATIPLVYIAQRLERGAMKVRAAVLSATAVFLLMLAPVVARTWTAGENLPQLNIYTGPRIVSPRRVAQGFEREYHCKVNYDLYDSNEALLAKLQAATSTTTWWFPAITWWRFSFGRACSRPSTNPSCPTPGPTSTRDSWACPSTRTTTIRCLTPGVPPALPTAPTW